ncbi:response regulator transcription factor [Catellatospora sp. KI3]|uniref:response regulator n=1 Tax=Catellatospora sp. KI3 TaxID=3041620 RepID=UPI002482FA03|nr:response regulator transcription factor [Catellatospora sp. KI3]MDI1460904.1 response regulator transcription factor [Catellatospora sp. KI3]
MSSGDPIRVVIADDQQIVREGLVALLGLIDGVEVVGDAGDGAQVLALLDAVTADIALLDLRMPGTDGIEATRQITRRHPDVSVIMLTTYADDDSIGQALRAGARSYLTKNASRDQIAAALRATAQGQATFDPAVSQRLVSGLRPAADGQRWHNPDRLTAREVEVLRLMAQGLSNRDIARTLFIGESTVKTHVNNTFAKIGARDRADVTRYAYRHGLTG